MGVLTKRRLISKAKRHAVARVRQREFEQFLSDLRGRMQATADAAKFYRGAPIIRFVDAE